MPRIPSVGAKPPAVDQNLRVQRMALRHPIDLRLQDRADEVGVGAVHDELESFLRVLVVDLREVVLEREEPVLPRLLGELHHLLRGIRVIDVDAEERKLGGLDRGAHHRRARRGERRAGSSPEHDQDRRDVDECHRVAALHEDGQKQDGNGAADADRGDRLHEAPIRRVIFVALLGHLENCCDQGSPIAFPVFFIGAEAPSLERPRPLLSAVG